MLMKTNTKGLRNTCEKEVRTGIGDTAPQAGKVAGLISGRVIRGFHCINLSGRTQPRKGKTIYISWGV